MAQLALATLVLAIVSLFAVLSWRAGQKPAALAFAALGLLLGVAATAALLLQSRRRAADAEARLKELSTAFAALVADRFERWGLTRAEKDVAWFSIKGLGIAEIAALRQTSEGTVKAQLNAIYRKSGVSSRAELLSLFLDDLLAGADSAPMHKPLAAAAE